jgi:hypothetical protein
MKIESIGAVVACANLLGGCYSAANKVVSDPSNIALRTALIATVDAMAAARAESISVQEKGITLNAGSAPISVGAIGINPCTVTATFNIAANGTSGIVAGGTLDIAQPVDAALTVSNSNSVGTSRGNQITVAFTSPACNPSGSLGTSNPSEVTLLQREIDAARTGRPDPVKWPTGNLPLSASGSIVPKGDLSSLNGQESGTGPWGPLDLVLHPGQNGPIKGKGDGGPFLIK